MLITVFSSKLELDIRLCDFSMHNFINCDNVYVAPILQCVNYRVAFARLYLL